MSKVWGIVTGTVELSLIVCFWKLLVRGRMFFWVRLDAEGVEVGNEAPEVTRSTRRYRV